MSSDRSFCTTRNGADWHLREIHHTVSFKFTDPGLLDSCGIQHRLRRRLAFSPLSITTQGGTLTASHKFQIDGRAGSKSQTFVVTIGVNDNSGAVGTATSTVVVTGGGAE